ncbi:MAG: His/Gly/Thr/Pro-type tRNA ligase C-terminal domain-containing protein [Saprospiraceae bacterium]
MKFSFPCTYDDTGSIGKLYRRQDAIRLTILYCRLILNLLEDGTITIRDRDTLQQERVTVEQAEKMIREKD